MQKQNIKNSFLAFRKNKKGVVPQLMMFGLILLGMVALVGVILYVGDLRHATQLSVQKAEREAAQTEGMSEKQQEVVAKNCMLSDSVVMQAKNKYTRAAASAHSFDLWALGADTSDPNNAVITNASTSSGKATDTSGLWDSCYTNKDYDLYTNGIATYYDALIPDWYLVYQENTADSVMHFKEDGEDRVWHAVLPIGTISDFDTADACNGVTCVTTDTVELDDTGTDEITYNETAGDGTFTIDLSIGNTVAQTALNNLVYCLQDANTGTDAQEGNEVTSLSVQFMSGQDISGGKLQGELVQYWKESAGTGSYICKPLATLIDGATSGVYRFTFAVNEANWGSNEYTKFCVDDNSGYGKFQYPSGDVKATASCLTLKDRT